HRAQTATRAMAPDRPENRGSVPSAMRSCGLWIGDRAADLSLTHGRTARDRLPGTAGPRLCSATMSKDSGSEIFDPRRWRPVEGCAFKDITFHRAVDHGTVRIAFDRPEVRNAFRPRTVDELATALERTRFMTDVGCVLITGNGPSPKDGGWAF